MSAKRKLSAEQWAAIRQHWEYDPDAPTYNEAAERAGKKFGFEPPSKSTIDSRAKAEGWERRGSMTGINAAAQRKADTSAVSRAAAEGVIPADRTESDGAAGQFSDASDPKKAASAKEEAEDLRAKVIERHRGQWPQVVALTQEALTLRKTEPDKAKERMRLAKTLAETVTLQQSGERKAWGLDVVVDPDQMKNLSDEDLKAIAAGQAPRRTG